MFQSRILQFNLLENYPNNQLFYFSIIWKNIISIESSCAFQFKAIAPRDNRDIRLVQARHQVNRFSLIQKAKYRTLKMTLIIVLAYLICWSPYVALVLYSSYDYDAAQGIDPAIHEGIILFAASHSCVNPFVYRINLVRRFPAS